MAFKFSLEQVLRYRTQLEQEAKGNFAKAENERLREQKRLRSIMQTLEFEQNRLASLTPNELDNRWVIENFIKGLRVDLVESQRHLAYWMQKADEAKKILIEKAKDKKILEKLKEKQERKYVEEEKHREQRFFDEITTGKKSRQTEISIS